MKRTRRYRRGKMEARAKGSAPTGEVEARVNGSAPTGETEARVKVSAPTGETVDLVLNGPPKAVADLIEKLKRLGNPLDVAGAQCAFALSNNGSTVHMLLDLDE